MNSTKLDNHGALAGQVERGVRPAVPKRAAVCLRWKKTPKETGLRAVGAGPRGSNLHDGVKEYASVNALGGNPARKLVGWYWVCTQDVGGEHVNTFSDPAPDEETAKAQALAYVKAVLAKRA
jgi:hypothetical protein